MQFSTAPGIVNSSLYDTCEVCGLTVCGEPTAAAAVCEFARWEETPTLVGDPHFNCTVAGTQPRSFVEQ